MDLTRSHDESSRRLQRTGFEAENRRPHKEAEQGHLSLITKRGRPAILAVPFDERLLELGVHRALALRLFERRDLTVVQSAKLAAMTAEEFVALLGDAGIPAVDYPPDELAEEAQHGTVNRVVVADTGP